MKLLHNRFHFQEGALERLYRWTQQCCRSTDFFSNIDLLTECLSRLQDRTVLFKYECFFSLIKLN